MAVVELGSDQGRPRRRWPLVAAVGWNIALIVVAMASASVVRNDALNTRAVVSIGGWFLLISSLAGLLATLVVWALLALHDRTGSRWSLLTARILSGLVVGAAVSSIGAFVGLFLLPTGAALVVACVPRSRLETWYPAATAQVVSK